MTIYIQTAKVTWLVFPIRNQPLLRGVPALKRIPFESYPPVSPLLSPLLSSTTVELISLGYMNRTSHHTSPKIFKINKTAISILP